MFQDHCEDIIQARAIINPSELWQCDVNILTPNILKNNTKNNVINGRLRIVLDSVEELSTNYSPLLYCSNLLGHVGLTNISFDQNPLTLKKNGQSMNGILEITNNSELPINLFAHQNTKQSSEFTIQPDKFKLAVNEKIKLKIMYFPSKLFNYPKYFSHFSIFYSFFRYFINSFILYILEKRVFVYKFYLHKNSFLSKSTVLMILYVIIIIFITCMMYYCFRSNFIFILFFSRKSTNWLTIKIYISMEYKFI